MKQLLEVESVIDKKNTEWAKVTTLMDHHILHTANGKDFKYHFIETSTKLWVINKTSSTLSQKNKETQFPL